MYVYVVAYVYCGGKDFYRKSVSDLGNMAFEIFRNETIVSELGNLSIVQRLARDLAHSAFNIMITIILSCSS